jgi:hypothetical protein
MLLALALACGTSLQLGGADPGEPDGSSGPSELGDAPEPAPEPEEPDFFADAGVVHTVDLTIGDDAWRALQRLPYEYVEASAVVDGAAFDRVGVRLRGKIGSFRDLDGKPKFKIDFNRFVADQRLGELETLALNNAVVDCSYVREPAGYAMVRAAGLPAPRTVHARVTVNGEDYGLYVAVEFPDDVFLARHYADPSGNLYDGKYAYWSNGRYELIDFTLELQGNFQLEEGVWNDLADVDAVTRAAAAAEGGFAERMGPVLDLPSFHRHIAAEQWLGHLDGYALNTNNYRVYFDPEDGLAELLVYDLDYAFLDDSAWGMDWSAPRGVVVQACWADAACVETQRAAVEALVADVDTDALLAELDAAVALIEEDARSDPRRECLRRDIAPDQAYVRAWVAGASEALWAAWAGR